MGPKFLQVVLCMTVICGFIEGSYGLMCLRCESKTVNGTCKNSRKFHLSSKRHQSCYGRRPNCYAKATVDEMGYAHFERGCTLKNICNESVDTKYCSMCNSKFCNYEAMVLDQQVEDFSKQVRNSKRFHHKTPNKTKLTEPLNTNQTVADSIPINISETRKNSISVYETLSVTDANPVPKIVPETLNETRPNTLMEDVVDSIHNNVSKTMTLTESDNKTLSKNNSVDSEPANSNYQIVMAAVPVNVSEFSNQTTLKAPIQTKSDDISKSASE